MTQLILEFENSTIRHRLLKVIELMDGVTIVNPELKRVVWTKHWKR